MKEYYLNLINNLMINMAESEAYTDVVELCALLQCLGFRVKSFKTSDGNLSQDGGTRTIDINCQMSGLHVKLESTNVSCSCPSTAQHQNSGVWEVSGMAGGKQLDKEFGCSILGCLPKGHRERLTKELHEIIRCIKQNESFDHLPQENKSASMIELTPDKKIFDVKPETPTRYRSLDTLTAAKAVNRDLPTPGSLRSHLVSESAKDVNLDKKSMGPRQSTYTLSSTSGSFRRRNKTSSPIKTYENSVLEKLMAAEKTAEDLCSNLSCVIKELLDDTKNDSSISSLALDVSKISVLKVAESSKAQFASSPNLSGVTGPEDFLTNRLKGCGSASTSNLSPNVQSKDGKPSRLRRLSPNLFKKLRKEATPAVKPKQDEKTKSNSIFRLKVTPINKPTRTPEPSPNLSASTRKKYSHIKSTIPRPSKKD